MIRRIDDIRRQQIAAYKAALGEEAWTGIEGGNHSDFDYVTHLSLIAERAPRHVPLDVGSRRRLADLGLLGIVIKTCGSLSATLEIWRRHADMMGEPVRLMSEVTQTGDGSIWRLQFEPLPFLSAAVARLCIDELLATFFSFATEVTGYHFQDFTVELPYPPDDTINFRRYFPGTIVFNCRIGAITGPARILHLPAPSADSRTHEQLLGQFRASVPTQPAPPGGEAAAQLRHYFVKMLGGNPTLPLAAAALGTSLRTLNRRLELEQTSYRDVLADFRCTYAKALLSDGTLCAKQIAHAVGYHSEKCLHRAFLRWTGLSMGQWRTEQRGPRREDNR